MTLQHTNQLPDLNISPIIHPVTDVMWHALSADCDLENSKVQAKAKGNSGTSSLRSYENKLYTFAEEGAYDATVPEPELNAMCRRLRPNAGQLGNQSTWQVSPLCSSNLDRPVNESLKSRPLSTLSTRPFRLHPLGIARQLLFRRCFHTGTCWNDGS